MTGTTKAWLGRFGEVGHPYTHPSTKQCNYSVDTSSFATKAYVDGKIGSIKGVTKTFNTAQQKYSKKAGEYWYDKVYTHTYSINDIGFIPTYMLFTIQSISVSCNYGNSVEYTSYTGLPAMTDEKIYANNTWSKTISYTDSEGNSSYTVYTITLLDTAIQFTHKTHPPFNGSYKTLNVSAFTFTALLYG